MQCSVCGEKVEIDLEVSGGCQGHGEGEYCYCDSLDAKAYYQCMNKKCKQKRKNIKIYELSDQYSISRWLTENYEPKDAA